MGKATCCEWKSKSGGEHPKDSVRAGVDSGEKVYVARAHYDGALVPGKLHNTHSCVYIPYAGEEKAVHDYEVLVAPAASLSWVPASGGDIPADAVVGGHDASGETYYIGRVIHNGTVTVGKVHPSHGSCYVPYGGQEHGYGDYEILVRNALGRFMNV